jgi:3-phenylpropionate/trans-cinnamate dioxygenase ferredoxin subunit
MAESTEQWLPAGPIAGIPAGRVKLIEAGDLRIAVCNVDGHFYAIDDVCTHDGGPLDQGQVDGDEIECPRHGARFNVRTGEATLMPAVMGVRTFPVRVDGDQVYVRAEPNG